MAARRSAEQIENILGERTGGYPVGRNWGSIVAAPDAAILALLDRPQGSDQPSSADINHLLVCPSETPRVRLGEDEALADPNPTFPRGDGVRVDVGPDAICRDAHFEPSCREGRIRQAGADQERSYRSGLPAHSTRVRYRDDPA